MTLNFNLQGVQRKRLVHAISEIMGDEAKYLKTPTYAYQVGEYHIDKNGVVAGLEDKELEADLRKLGFEISETPTMDEAEIPSAESEAEPQEGEAHAPSATDEAHVQDEADEPSDEADRFTIEMPLDGFDPPKLENLCKMVEAKAPLLVMALGVDNLNIQQVDGKVKFPWFKGNLDSETVNAYATLISKLCETAKKKARVTAKTKEADDNPKFSFRVWLISLGMVGAEFKDVRRILLAKLPGNSAWKAGSKPAQATTDSEVGEAPASTTEQEASTDMKTEYEMMMEQLPEGTRILRQYNAAEDGEYRIITDENGEKRYMVEREENGYPRLIHKP